MGGGVLRGLGLVEGTHLQTASGAVLCDDVHVGIINTAANEASQVLILNISHLRQQTAHNYDLQKDKGPFVNVLGDQICLLTCFSSNRTSLVSSIRFLLMYFMAARFPCNTQQQHQPFSSSCGRQTCAGHVSVDLVVSDFGVNLQVSLHRH